jgi:hypothetical protein
VLLRFSLPLRTATHAALHRLDIFYTTEIFKNIIINTFAKQELR